MLAKSLGLFLKTSLSLDFYLKKALHGLASEDVTGLTSLYKSARSLPSNYHGV